MVNLGDIFPNFTAQTTKGDIKFHDWLGDSWGILFSHPRDYTPVCTTEVGRLVQLNTQFKEKNVKLIGLSCDTVEDHNGWSRDVVVMAKCDEDYDIPFPIIADSKRELAVQLGMIDPDEKDDKGMPLTARALFIVGPDKKLKLSILYPATTGRNMDEIVRVIDSLQLTYYKKVATPVDWKYGEKCMVVPTLSDEEARKLFPAGFEIKKVPSGKGYLRYTPHPK